MFTTRVSLRHATMFTYSHANTPLGQSERAHNLSYFINAISAPTLSKGGEIRDTKTLNLSRNIVSLQVLDRCFAFFSLRDQPVAQQ